MLRVAIVDDQQLNIDQFSEYIARYQSENSLEFDVCVYRDGSEIVKDYQPEFDIIILDVEMPAINGLDAARMIREKDKKVVLLFVTNMAQYAIRGYEVEALDFVLKPVNYFTFSVRFARAVARANERMGGKVVLQTSEGTILLNTRPYRKIQGDRYLVSDSVQGPLPRGRGAQKIQFMFGGSLHRVQFEYLGPDIDAVLDRLPTATVAERKGEPPIVTAEVFGTGITMWLRSQGGCIKMIDPPTIEELPKQGGAE